MAQVVYSHVNLKSFLGLFPCWGLKTRIIYEDIYTIINLFDSISKGFNWFLVTQIQREIHNVSLRIFLPDFIQHLFWLDLISGSKDNGTAFLGKFQNGLPSNASISSSDDDHLSLHVSADPTDTTSEVQFK